MDQMKTLNTATENNPFLKEGQAFCFASAKGLDSRIGIIFDTESGEAIVYHDFENDWAKKGYFSIVRNPEEKRFNDNDVVEFFEWYDGEMTEEIKKHLHKGIETWCKETNRH